jgi:hypothetical protein
MNAQSLELEQNAIKVCTIDYYKVIKLGIIEFTLLEKP